MSQSDAPKIEMIQDTALLRAWLHVGHSDRLVLCFSGVGDGPTLPISYEFAKVASGSGRDNVLFIADPNRSWLSQPGLVGQIVALIDQTKKRLGIGQVVALGNSMGGFSACVIPHFTPVDHVLAIAPQVSIDPAIVPDEDRWMEYRQNIGSIAISSVGDHMMPDTRYFVLHGQHKIEAPQRDRFPVADNLWLFVMPKTRHDPARKLKKLGHLDHVRDLALDGDSVGLAAFLHQTTGAVVRDQLKGAIA
jgi:pimeloyl-ACP methyl ester carboxylesterase